MTRLKEPQLLFSKGSVLVARHLHIQKIFQMLEFNMFLQL